MAKYTPGPWRYSCSDIEPNLCRIEWDDPHQPDGFARLVMHVDVSGVADSAEVIANMELATAAPKMRALLIKLKDALESLPMDALGVTGFADFLSDMAEDGNLRDGVPYDTTNMYTRDLLLGNIERALRQEKGER